MDFHLGFLPWGSYLGDTWPLLISRHWPIDRVLYFSRLCSVSALSNMYPTTTTPYGIFRPFSKSGSIFRTLNGQKGCFSAPVLLYGCLIVINFFIFSTPIAGTIGWNFELEVGTEHGIGIGKSQDSINDVIPSLMKPPLSCCLVNNKNIPSSMMEFNHHYHSMVS